MSELMTNYFPPSSTKAILDLVHGVKICNHVSVLREFFETLKLLFITTCSPFPPIHGKLLVYHHSQSLSSSCLLLILSRIWRKALCRHGGSGGGGGEIRVGFSSNLATLFSFNLFVLIGCRCRKASQLSLL